MTRKISDLKKEFMDGEIEPFYAIQELESDFGMTPRDAESLVGDWEDEKEGDAS